MVRRAAAGLQGVQMLAEGGKEAQQTPTSIHARSPQVQV